MDCFLVCSNSFRSSRLFISESSTVQLFNNLSYMCGPEPLTSSSGDLPKKFNHLPSFQSCLSVDTAVLFYVVGRIHLRPPGRQTLKSKQYCTALLLQLN
mmetsp:Transcript_13543/g.20296  ORF Transcript_13543/g.20296 Transcript_13543/m.20296 type:complete len:99 (+) Transcript_13543:29-325(+)